MIQLPERRHWPWIEGEYTKGKNYALVPDAELVDWCKNPEGCKDCRADIVGMILNGNIKITPKLMASISSNILRQEIVKAVCLRVINGGGNAKV